MAVQHDLQRMVLDLQERAQGNLPVIPNNGNPQGANNMPTQDTNLPPVAGGARHYPWLNPSPSMDIIQKILGRPLQTGGVMPPTQVPSPPSVVLPAMSTNLPPTAVPSQLPIMSTGLPAQPAVLPRPVFQAKYPYGV